MDETNSGQQNEDNSSVLLLLKQCLVLLDKYNNCLTVMFNNCKCDQNIENKLLFNDLLSKYKTIIIKHKIFLETIDISEPNYYKFGLLFENDLSKDINKDNETVVNECIIEPNIEENENNVNTDLNDNNNNTNDNNLTQNNQTINQQNSEENENITENVNQNFEYLSKSLIDNKIDTIKEKKQKSRKVMKKTNIRSKNMKSKVKSKKTQTNTKKEIKLTLELKTENSNNNLMNQTIDNSNDVIPQLLQPVIINEVFECDKCVQFIRIEDRESHYKSVHNIFMDPITIDKCYICELEFNKRSDYIAHNKEHHYKRPFTCEKLIYGKVCGKVYGRFKDLTKHAKRAHGRETPFKCSECDKQYPLLKQLNMHKKKFHSKKKFVCDWNDCEFTTFEKYLLTKHQRRHLTPKSQKTPKLEDDSEKLFKCSDCGKEYNFAESLRKHMEQLHREHKYVCDWHDCQFSTSVHRRLLVHKNRHLQVKSYHCDWPGCDSSFVDKWDLYQHSTRHSDSKFCCPHCDQLCKTTQYLKQHIMVMHTIERPYECDQCEKKFALKTRLTEHVRKSHGEKQFQCDECDFKTSLRQSLAKHKRCVHLRERTYRCDIDGCDGKSFFARNELLAHQMSAHSDVRQFVCDWPECGAAFKLKGNLTEHVKTIHKGNKRIRKNNLNKTE